MVSASFLSLTPGLQAASFLSLTPELQAPSLDRDLSGLLFLFLFGSAFLDSFLPMSLISIDHVLCINFPCLGSLQDLVNGFWYMCTYKNALALIMGMVLWVYTCVQTQYIP